MKIPANMQQIMHGLVEGGNPFILIEVRGCKVEEVKYISKVDGKQAGFTFWDLACETVGESAKQINVRLDTPRGSKKQEDGRLLDDKGIPVAVPYKKGDKCLVLVRTIENQKGAIRIQAISTEPWLDKP